MIHHLYSGGKLQIESDEKRHTRKKFFGIFLKHVPWCSKFPGPLVVCFKTPLNENVLFRGLIYKSERNFPFFMPDGKSGRNFSKWPQAGFYPDENRKIWKFLSDYKVEIFRKSHPASSPIFRGPFVRVYSLRVLLPTITVGAVRPAVAQQWGNEKWCPSRVPTQSIYLIYNLIYIWSISNLYLI